MTLTFGLTLMGCAEEKTGQKSGKKDGEHANTNRLAGETSPYLLQHAHNPVDWYPWGEEAFEKARKENKPIFLSVGYSTCHWCHVMERESFSDPEIAAAMNKNFVNIKLDREERPDVDRVYMTFVQATTGGGGWPMSVWLTPDLEPFVGGTYFPPEDKFGRPGFGSIVEQLGEAWRKDEEKIREQAGQTVEQLRRFTEGGSAMAPGGDADDDKKLDASELERGYEAFASRFDEKEGGFGPAPKFPRPSELVFLFSEAERVGLDSERGARALEMAVFTLEKMAAGGMHDHLGGGFHRYSVDERWHVPHFEKMLYDQAQLAEVYLTGYRLTGRGDFADTARDIFDYVLRDMTDSDGAFYSAEDADSYVDEPGGEKAEGAFYVWTAEEIEAVLGKERAAEFAYVHGVEEGGNAKPDGDPHGELRGKNTLYLAHSIAEAAEEFDVSVDVMEERIAAAREALFEARKERPRPHLDDKVIVAWNGLMISAFARGHRVLGEERYLDAARGAASFLRDNLYDAEQKKLTRVWREGPSDIGGFVEDYAYLVDGLLHLYLSDPDVAWLEWALALQATQDDLFADEEQGGYYSSTGTDPSVLLRMKEDHDGAEPSPNSVSALNLLRLSHLLAEPDYEKRALETLSYLGPRLTQTPTALPLALSALGRAMAPGVQIVIVGDRDDAATQTMLEAIHDSYLPGAVWAVIDDEAESESRDWFASRAEFYQTVKTLDGKSTAYLCRNFVCELPTADPAQFRKQLESQDPRKDETDAP